MAATHPVDLYDLPAEFVEFRDMIRQLVRERVAPRAAEIDATAEYPWDLRKLFAEQDLFGLPFSTEHGGTGTGALMLNIAVEEIAKACASSALMLMLADLGQHAEWIAELRALGFDHVYLHHVGREQRRFIEAFGEHVLPRL